MKKGIREQIISTACTLFNEYGYLAVSMRQIADTLGISVGNLTYYFKRKEDLICAAFLSQHRSLPTLDAPQSLEELDELFRTMIKRQQEGAYFFRHFVQLANTCPPIYEKQLAMLKKQFAILNQTFDKLQEDGIVECGDMEEQQTYLVLAIMMVYIYWTPQVQFTQQIYPNLDILVSLWSLILPHLTAKGKAIYQEQIASHRAVEVV